MLIHHTTSKPHQTVGGKAEGLFRLKSLSLLVPPFVVIPAETFDVVLAKVPLDSAQRRAALMAFSLPANDQQALAAQLTEWGFPNVPVVVRSSVADEDGRTHAFAGMMDSFLNLTTLPDVLTAIGHCAVSAYSERAAAYRQQHGLSLLARPAVIVQQQITPNVSGVLFTTYPNYPQELAIHAVRGLGDALMHGDVPADEFYLLKTPGDRRGDCHRTYHPNPNAALSLSEKQFSDLFRFGTYLEKWLGYPQDVEFALTDEDIVWFVQTRPITQPIPEVVVYDNANIQESYCGVTTPLTFSFASRAYATVYRQTMQALGLPADQIRANEPIVTNLLGLVKGRIYYNINNWYRGLQLLPSFKQNKADMERMMGLTEPVDFVQDTEKTVGQKLRLLPGLLLNLSRLLWAFSWLKQTVPAFLDHCQQHYRRFYKLDLNDLSVSELLDEKGQLDTNLLGNWSTPIINDFYVMMTNGQVTRRLRQLGLADPDEFLSRYLSGDRHLASTQPVWAMQQLSAEARQQPDLRAWLLTNPTNVQAQVRTQFPTFWARVNEFIDHYGDRTVGELKLETVTMRLDPDLFYTYLRNYLTADTPATHVPASLHTEAEAELTKLLTNVPAWRRQGVRRALGRLQRAIQFRESMRLERTRLFGMYRATYLALGQKLTEAGQLTHPRDVFYLTETEIEQAATSNHQGSVNELVDSRKVQFARYEHDDVPGRVVIPSPPMAPAPPAPAPGTWHGTGCVSGEVEGEAIVVTDPRDSLAVTGKIVCALRTDPGWAVLFPTCRAVLIERGSSLSHSVILLRELGIPTIINVPGLTRAIHSGQRLRIDGATGLITLL